MNNYILLDTLKYMTPAKNWTPVPGKPATVRINLDGSTDATYGPGVIFEWRGAIIAPVTPIDVTWGTKADLDVTIAKRQPIAFVDHYGTSCNVHVLGPFAATSRSPKWDGASNEFEVEVTLVRIY